VPACAVFGVIGVALLENSSFDIPIGPSSALLVGGD
jgi:hypothetical protein